jgi:hypothetical protein
MRRRIGQCCPGTRTSPAGSCACGSASPGLRPPPSAVNADRFSEYRIGLDHVGQPQVDQGHLTVVSRQHGRCARVGERPEDARGNQVGQHGESASRSWGQGSPGPGRVLSGPAPAASTLGLCSSAAIASSMSGPGHPVTGNRARLAWLRLRRYARGGDGPGSGSRGPGAELGPGRHLRLLCGGRGLTVSMWRAAWLPLRRIRGCW